MKLSKQLHTHGWKNEYNFSKFVYKKYIFIIYSDIESFLNNTDSHEITEILLKAVLNTITLTLFNKLPKSV
jgi:hypothetical protein